MTAFGHFSVATIHLGYLSPDTSCSQPRQRCEKHICTCLKASAICLYSALLPVGFDLPPLLPEARCALTAPFHPYQLLRLMYKKARAGGLFSVSLSLGLPPPGVTWHRVFRGARTFLTTGKAYSAAAQPPLLLSLMSFCHEILDPCAQNVHDLTSSPPQLGPGEKAVRVDQESQRYGLELLSELFLSSGHRVLES